MRTEIAGVVLALAAASVSGSSDIAKHCSQACDRHFSLDTEQARIDYQETIQEICKLSFKKSHQAGHTCAKHYRTAGQQFCEIGCKTMQSGTMVSNTAAFSSLRNGCKKAFSVGTMSKDCERGVMAGLAAAADGKKIRAQIDQVCASEGSTSKEPVVEQVKAEPVKPKADPVPHKTEPVKPKAEPVKPKAEPVEPKAEPVEPKAEPVKPKAEPIKRNIRRVEEPEPVKEAEEAIAKPEEPVEQIEEAPAFKEIRFAENKD